MSKQTESKQKLPVLKVIWDESGFNQWGTRWISAIKCPECKSDIPSNMYGQGTCVQCHINVKP